MNSLITNLATALVTTTFGIAAVSMFVTIFLGAV